MEDYNMEETAIMTTVEQNAMTNVEQNAMTTFSDTLMQDVSEQGYWASFPVESMEDKKVLFAAREDNILLKDHMGEVIPLVGVVIDTVDVNSEIGVKTVPCVHLIAEDGTVYQSASSGVVKTTCKLISSFGNPSTWNEPIDVVCKETTTAKGFRYKYLGIV